MTPLRRRLSYANITATLALVLSMSGGALAASHNLITSTRQLSPRVRKQLKGNAGPAGPQGPQGPQGGPGGQGPAGTAAAWGTVGINFSLGTPTVSFVPAATSGFPSQPLNPQEGVFCIQAPANPGPNASVALTLQGQFQGFVSQAPPDKCGSPDYEILTFSTSGTPTDLPFTIVVP